MSQVCPKVDISCYRKFLFLSSAAKSWRIKRNKQEEYEYRERHT